MKWKRIKCFLTGGHRLYDKNLQTIHDTNGYPTTPVIWSSTSATVFRTLTASTALM